MSIRLVLGASNHTEEDRQKNDFYATDPSALEKFLSSIDFKLSKNVWECACGDGSLSKLLVKKGYNVRSTDLVDRGYGDIQDFLKSSEIYNGDILTNPPFKKASEFAFKALSLVETGSKVIFFLKIQFLEGGKRYSFFKKNPPKYVYVHSSRVSIYKNGDVEKYKKNTNTICFAWYVWEKGYTGETMVRWIK